MTPDEEQEVSKIIVAFDGTEQSEDALRLAMRLSGAYRNPHLIIAAAYAYELYEPYEMGTYEVQRERFFERALAGASGFLGADGHDFRRIEKSPARGLFELAEAEAAELLVLGSSHRSKVGQLLLGSTASKLLRASPCAIAVAPRGYALGPSASGLGDDDRGS